LNSPTAFLLIASIAFVGTHFLMSHPLRDPMVRAMGEGPFRGVYSLVSLVTFGAMIYAYRAIGRETPFWDPGDLIWLVGSILMWLASILFVGSFAGNPGLVGARRPSGGPKGVLGITRHPMMWSFALWALVHCAVVATPKAMILDAAIFILAVFGSVGQDAKKRKLMGEAWHVWSAKTAFIPFSKGLANPGVVALIGGTLLFVAATWAHGAIGGMPAGFWRWIG